MAGSQGGQAAIQCMPVGAQWSPVPTGTVLGDSAKPTTQSGNCSVDPATGGQELLPGA